MRILNKEAGFPQGMNNSTGVASFIRDNFQNSDNEDVPATYAHTVVFSDAIWYHGRNIVRAVGDSLYIRTTGWFSTSTKRRLNAVLEQYALFMFTRAGEWYISNGTYSIPYREIASSDGGIVNGYTWVSVDDILQTFNKVDLT